MPDGRIKVILKEKSTGAVIQRIVEGDAGGEKGR